MGCVVVPLIGAVVRGIVAGLVIGEVLVDVEEVNGVVVVVVPTSTHAIIPIVTYNIKNRHSTFLSDCTLFECPPSFPCFIYDLIKRERFSLLLL